MSFYLKVELLPAIYYFKHIGFFWRISLNHPFSHVGWVITRNSCSHPFFQGLYGTHQFWQQLLTKNIYFFEKAIIGIQFFQGFVLVYLFYHSNYGHPSFAVRYLLVTEIVAVIHSLKDTVFILTGDLAVIHCLSTIFSAIVCLFPKKKVGFSYAFFQRYYDYF